MSPPAFLDRFVGTFIPKPFLLLARQTRWSQRQGKIDPFEFLTSLIFGQMAASRPTLSSQVQSLAEPVSRQALAQRYNPRAVAYVQAAFGAVMAQTLDWAPAHPHARSLQAHFAALYLLDSTSFDCPASLQEIFPACGGAGSAANVKVLLRYEVITGRLEPLQVLAGKRSDQGLALKTAERLTANQLQLQDKGFYDAKAWRAAQQRGAYLLLPLPHAVTLWQVGADAQETELDLAAALAHSDAQCLEWPAVQLGRPGQRVSGIRLVAFRLSPESAARQRQGLRESQRRQGRTPSAKALQLAGWRLLITNAPGAKLPTALVSYLYRLRWQIELIFRQMKTGLRLDQTESHDRHRVQCEIWARLIGAVLLFLWHAHANAESALRQRGEVSFEKLIRLMQHWGLIVARAFLSEPRERLQCLRALWKQILANAGKGRQKSRPTTWENLAERWLNPPASI